MGTRGRAPAKEAPHGHVHRRDLILRLLVDKAERRTLPDQGGRHGGGGGHGIEGDEIAARGKRAQGQGLVAVDHHPFRRALRRRRDAGKIEILLPHPIERGAHHVHVGLHNGLAFSPECLGQKIFQDDHVVADRGPEHAKGDGIMKKRLGSQLLEGDAQYIEALRIDVVPGQHDGSLGQPGAVLFDGLRIERHQDVNGFDRPVQFIRPHAHGERVMAAAHARHVPLVHQQMVSGPDDGP